MNAAVTKLSNGSRTSHYRCTYRFDGDLALHCAGQRAAADRLIDKIDRTLDLLAAFPQIGEAVEHLRHGVRRFNVGNYQLFYEACTDGVRLLRVYHAARRIEELFDD